MFLSPRGPADFPWSAVLAWNSEQGLHVSCPRPCLPSAGEGSGLPGGACYMGGRLLPGGSLPALGEAPGVPPRDRRVCCLGIPLAALTPWFCCTYSALCREELEALFLPYDLKRLEMYSQNMVDYHLIMDLIPAISRLYFLNQLGDLALSAAQSVGGLQLCARLAWSSFSARNWFARAHVILCI